MTDLIVTRICVNGDGFVADCPCLNVLMSDCPCLSVCQCIRVCQSVSVVCMSVCRMSACPCVRVRGCPAVSDRPFVCLGVSDRPFMCPSVTDRFSWNSWKLTKNWWFSWNSWKLTKIDDFPCFYWPGGWSRVPPWFAPCIPPPLPGYHHPAATAGVVMTGHAWYHGASDGSPGFFWLQDNVSEIVHLWPCFLTKFDEKNTK